ncbi:MAG: tetratricopeptide repeat protein [Planctomycetota bacterium]
MQRNRPRFDRLTTGIVAVLLACQLAGCRTIQRIGDRGEVLDARKKSRLGMQALHQHRWQEAEQLFSEALTLSDGDDRAHRGIAETLWNRGETELALKHMQLAVKRSGSDPRLIGRLGAMYLEIGRLQDAEAQCDLALAAARDLPEVWTLHGDCLKARENREGALAAYHRALAIDPGLVSTKLRVAELYLGDDQYDRVLATLDQIDSSEEEAATPIRVHMLRGIAMRNLGRPELASKHFANAVERDPNRAEPHLQIAAIELEQGRIQLASRAVARAMELNPRLVQLSGWSAYLESDPNSIANPMERAEQPPSRR